MKKIVMLALLALSASVAQSQSILIRHSVEAAHKLPGDHWWGSSLSGTGTTYHVAYRSSVATVSGGMTWGVMSGEGSATADSESAQSRASAFAFIDDNTAYDQLTFQSASLPLGTPVTLEVTLDLFSRQVNANANMGVTAWVSCGVGKAAFITIQTAGVSMQSQTGQCHSSVGSTMPLDGVFYGRVSAEAINGDVASGSFVANARYSVRVLTEGVSFSSASGSLYLAQPVPEPASAALLLGGLALLRLRQCR
jgi:hypothetical protein